MLFNRFRCAFGICILATIALSCALSVPIVSDAVAQDLPSKEDMKEVQKTAGVMVQLQQMAFSNKVSDALEVTPDQKKKILVMVTKLQEKMMKMRAKPGEKFDYKEYGRLSEEMIDEVKTVLSEKQWKKLKERGEKSNPMGGKNYSPEKAKEMQRMSGLMQELMRLSYDASLAEKLEITTEQKIEIRELQQRYTLAMQDANKEGTFDMEQYNIAMAEMMESAQEILTPEQSEKLGRSAKLKQLKQRHGDPFAMINGLAMDYDLDKKALLELKENIEAARDAHYEKLKKLNEDTLEQIIKSVPEKHRDEVREAVSEFFEDDPRKKRNPYGGAWLGN